MYQVCMYVCMFTVMMSSILRYDDFISNIVYSLRLMHNYTVTSSGLKFDIHKKNRKDNYIIPN